MLKKSNILMFLVSVAIYIFLWFLVPKAVFLPAMMNFLGNTAKSLSTVVLMTISTIIFMAVQIAIVFFFSKLRMNVLETLLAFLLSLLGVVALVSLVIIQLKINKQLGYWPNLRIQLYIMGTYFGPLKVLMVLFIMIASTALGKLVSFRVADKNLLLPVVMFAAYIDFWTVNHGPVSAALKHAPDIVSAVSAPIPKVGTGSFVPNTMIGPGDFIFMGLVFAAVCNLGMNGKRNYWFIFTTMTIGMLAVMLGALEFLPALTVLAIGTVAANWKEFHLSRQEKISTAIVGVLLISSLPLVWWFIGSKTGINNPRPSTKIIQSEKKLAK